jgi:hypothetical protein
MKRFNKTNLLDYLKIKVDCLQEEWDFDPKNGWAQVEKASFEKIMAYGEYDAYRGIIDSIEYNSL